MSISAYSFYLKSIKKIFKNSTWIENKSKWNELNRTNFSKVRLELEKSSEHFFKTQFYLTKSSETFSHLISSSDTFFKNTSRFEKFTNFSVNLSGIQLSQLSQDYSRQNQVFRTNCQKLIKNWKFIGQYFIRSTR